MKCFPCTSASEKGLYKETKFWQNGGPRRQISRLGQRRATDGQFEHQIIAQAVDVIAVVAVNVATGGLENALAEQVR